MRVLAPEQTKGINFLEADKADAKPALNLKKELVVCATLIGAIAVFSLVGLFVRLSHLETDYARIKNKTTELFKATLPEEKIIGWGFSDFHSGMVAVYCWSQAGSCQD